jgi:pentose-5-phosphate-3-epimerase
MPGAFRRDHACAPGTVDSHRILGLSAEFTRLGDEVRTVDSACGNSIQVDVMDGRFVPKQGISAHRRRSLPGSLRTTHA